MNYSAFLRIEANNFVFRANIDHVRTVGIYGSANTATISGRIVNSGISLFSIREVHLENPLISDPWACGQGWDGRTEPYYNNTLNYNKMPMTPPNNYAQGKWRGIQLAGATGTETRLTGSLELEWGLPLWFFSNINYLGTGSTDRFEFKYKDIGYTKEGLLVGDVGGRLLAGKMDPIFTRSNGSHSPTSTSKSTWYVVHEVLKNDFGIHVKALTDMEATSEHMDLQFFSNSIDAVYRNAAVDDRFRNDGDAVISSIQYDRDNRACCHLLRSDGRSPAATNGWMIIRDSTTIVDGQWHSISIAADASRDIDPSFIGTSSTTVTLTGNVLVKKGAKGSRLTNVKWIGAPRDVLTIQGEAEVIATNVSAPKGSVIRGYGKLVLNGKQVSLPYTFATGDSGGPSNYPPTSDDVYVATSSGTPVSLYLKASDPDDAQITYQLVTQPTRGSLSGTPPNLTYTPQNGFVGIDSFSFRASDGQATSSTATVTIDVSGKPGPVAPTVHTVDLQAGWNIVSLNVVPENESISSVLSDIHSDLVLAESGNGNVYYPEYNMNGITSWEADEAYRVFVESGTSLDVEGLAVIPAAIPIDLQGGWNLVPYLLDTQQPVEVALQSLGDRLVMVKDEDGRLYDRAKGVDQIGDMVPGDGYQVYVNGPATLRYGAASDELGRWTFDGASSSTVADETGNGNDGTVVGATVSSDARQGKSMKFDGVDDYVDVGALDVAGDQITIAAWFKADDFEETDAHIIAKGTAPSLQQIAWMLGTDNHGGGIVLRFRVHTNGTEAASLEASSGNIQTGEWVHAVARYDGSHMTLFKNGVQVGSMPHSGAIAVNPNVPVRIGDVAGSVRKPFDGVIDDVRLYDRALSDEEIQSLYHGASAGI